MSAKVQFDDAKDNFFAAARHGLNAQLAWVDGKHHSVHDLVLKRLLPLARAGLGDAQINSEDIDRYLGTVQERVETAQTGSQWMLSAAAAFPQRVSHEIRDHGLVATMLARQESGQPVHRWHPIARQELDAIGAARETVAEIMSTDLFTVSPDDPITLAASMMDWRHIRHLPVDQNGQLAGLISSRDVLRLLSAPGQLLCDRKTVTVGELMCSQPLTVTRETPIKDAINLMLASQVDCLPVLEGNELIGIVTTHDMLEVLSLLLRERTTSS